MNSRDELEVLRDKLAKLTTQVQTLYDHNRELLEEFKTAVNMMKDEGWHKINYESSENLIRKIENEYNQHRRQ